MTGELRYEWRRITTVRSPWICLALAFVAGAGLTLLGTAETSGDGAIRPNPWLTMLTVPLMVANILATVVAAQALGQEYRFGMIRLTLTAFPRRLPMLAAKGAVVVLWCVGLFLVCLAGSWLALVVRAAPTPDGGIPGGTAGLLLRALLVLVGWAGFAFAITAITRLTPLGITLPLVWGLLVEGLLMALLRWDWLSYVLPFRAASAATARGDVDGPLTPWSGLGVFWAWAVVLIVVGTVLFDRRDA